MIEQVSKAVGYQHVYHVHHGLEWIYFKFPIILACRHSRPIASITGTVVLEDIHYFLYGFLACQRKTLLINVSEVIAVDAQF